MTTTHDSIQNLARDYALAWSSGDPTAVAEFYAEDSEVVINRGDPCRGRAEITEMVRGFHSAFPDLELRCDLMRVAGSRALFVWTLEGHHDQTGNLVVTRGWDEWELRNDLKVLGSAIWFNADDYQRQIDGTG